MKKIKFNKLNLKRFCVSIVLVGILITNTIVFAMEEENLQPLHTEDFINWQSLSEEEKENTVIPRTYTTLMTDEILEQYNKNYISYREQILSRNFTKSLANQLIRAATYNSTSYNLNNDISVDVKHQGITNECWAFSVVSSLETNLELNKNIQKRFSTRHMDYATARTFKDGINPLGYGREVGDGGLAPFGLSYLTNGQGAVLESDMPFENNEEKINLADINKDIDTIVTSYVSLPTIYKKYDTNNQKVIYTNGGTGSSLVTYTDNEVEQMRNIIKDHIVKYGAVAAVTAGNHARYYNTSPINKATAYFCNDTTIVRDHAVTIIGWDDNYSKNNFTGSVKPYNDGAYIVLNSYGTENFDNGYLYISYEDVLIETLLYGIKSTSDVDYDKLYQYNPYGDNSALGIQGINEGYIASIYNRDASKEEVLNYVGISIPDNVSLEIYVNPNGNSTIISGLIKIAETEVLEPGYHRIPVKETKLTGNTFAIVVKEKSTQNRFYFSIETGVDNSIYENITGNPGKTLFSFDGYSWKNLSTQIISGLNMTKSDVCIKAFTEYAEIESEDKPTDEEKPTPDEENKPTDETKPNEEDNKITISSEIYEIKGQDIYKVVHNTDVKKFKENIETNSKTIEIYDEDGNKIKENEIIKNGMILKLSDGTSYELIVRGDLNCSGTISLIDFSKFLAHYTEDPNYALTGAPLKAADLSCDGKISLIDLSQMIVLYTSI